jgi:hypothetical protein
VSSVKFFSLVVEGWYQSALCLPLGSAMYELRQHFLLVTIYFHFDAVASLSRLMDKSAQMVERQ